MRRCSSGVCSGPPGQGRDRLVALIAVVGLGTAIRTQTALSLPTFHRFQPEAMLRSDPALLYYITQRILDSGGLPPADFRADPRIEHPEVSVGGRTFSLRGSYAAIPPGDYAALINSFDTLEIARSQQSAAEGLGVGRGAPVVVSEQAR